MAIRKRQRRKTQSTHRNDEWEIVGWVYPTSKNVCTVKFIDGVTKKLQLLGFVMNKTLERFAAGEIDAVPIKLPKGKIGDGYVPSYQDKDSKR